jgi:voltage-gated potassium channel Kch
VGPGDYTYFSFVTLTTVGYGDITAASDIAKRLVVVEAFIGQVFLITLVARLVSLWGKRLR